MSARTRHLWYRRLVRPRVPGKKLFPTVARAAKARIASSARQWFQSKRG